MAVIDAHSARFAARFAVATQVRPVKRRLRAGLALACLLAGAIATTPAAADPESCRRYRSELAELNGAGSTQRSVQSEIARLEAYQRSLNCEGGRFLIFDTRPPQCGAVEQRIRALSAGYGAQNAEVVSVRRSQLLSAVSTACSGVHTIVADLSGSDPRARGGGRVICVKTCDGSYFPMNNLPDGRGGADEMCQALCPGTEAVAYSMPTGDEALRSAATIKGNKAYSALPNAFKFRTSFTPSCSCKREGQTWAQALVKAESMLVRHKGDIFVTPLQAEALSRPKVRLTLVGRADRVAADLAADAASRTSVAREASAWSEPSAPGETAPAAAVPDERTAIRVIAPSMIPVPARSETP